VELGESNDVMVEVVAGLAEGEQVALTDPGHASTPIAPPAAASPRTDRAAAGRGNASTLQPR
jgi:hypothetical protein